MGSNGNVSRPTPRITGRCERGKGRSAALVSLRYYDVTLCKHAFNSRFFVEYEQPEFGTTRTRASAGDWIVVHSDERIEVVDHVTFHMLTWEMSEA